MSRSRLPIEIECEIPGKRCFCIWGEPFELEERYSPIIAIGKGAYGIVCSALDTATGQRVAIKKIANAFGHKTEAIRCLREVNLLRHISHPNIIKIRGIMRPASYDHFRDVYVVYECMDTDLHQIIQSKQPMIEGQFKHIIMQTLRGLKYLHSANIIHRDLKPSNLLLNVNCDLKIADFGLARSKDCRDDMTPYVVTRWYRAPEVILLSPYTSAIDLWSVGCILCELLKGSPLFRGNGNLQTLQNVVEIVGKPKEDDLRHIAESTMKQFIRNLPEAERKVESMFKDANPLAVNLMSSLLQFDPAKRPTAAQALRHPWLADARNPEAEIISKNTFCYEFDEDALNVNGIRELIRREIQIWNRRSRCA